MTFYTAISTARDEETLDQWAWDIENAIIQWTTANAYGDTDDPTEVAGFFTVEPPQVVLDYTVHNIQTAIRKGRIPVETH